MTAPTRQQTWFDELWPRVTAATGIGYLATAYLVSRWLTRSHPAVVPAPAQLGSCRLEALTCRTCDGIVLKGWLIEPPEPRATVALFHGMRGNRTKTLNRIAFLTAAGYRAVALDHRAHGESGGRVASFGYHERHDVEAVVALVRSRWPGERCAALGISMGAAALCFAAEASRGFDALILESVYHDLGRAFQHRVGRGYPPWLHHFRRGIIWITERRLGARIHQVAPVAHIAALAPRPVLLITGSDNPHAPPHEIEALAAQIPATGRFHIIPGAGHGDVCEMGDRAYRELLLAFLDRHLSQPALPFAA